MDRLASRLLRWCSLALALAAAHPAAAQYNRPATAGDTLSLATNYRVWRAKDGQRGDYPLINLDSLLVGGSGGTASYVLTTDGNGKLSWTSTNWVLASPWLSTANGIKVGGAAAGTAADSSIISLSGLKLKYDGANYLQAYVKSNGDVVLVQNTTAAGNARLLTVYDNSNVGLGLNALPGTDPGTGNIGIGQACAYSMTSSNYNIAVGYQTLYAHKTGDNNIAVGYTALANDTSGVGNVAIGGGALNLQNANNNVAIGTSAGGNHKRGDHNVIVGGQAALSDTGAIGATIVGAYAHYAAKMPHYATIVGEGAGYSTSIGSGNTIVGYTAGYTNTTGSNHVFIGFQAGYYETGTGKLFIDNTPRASEADARAKAMMYGEFAATTAAQKLSLNAVVTVADTFKAAGPSTLAGAVTGSGAWTTTGAIRSAGTGTASDILVGTATSSIVLGHSVTLADTAYQPLGVEFALHNAAIPDDSFLFGLYGTAGTSDNNVGAITWRSVGTSEDAANCNIYTMSGGVSYGSRFMADGDLNVGSTSDAGKDFAVFAAAAWTGFNQGDAGLTSSSSPSLKWAVQPVTADTLARLREVFADSLPMETWQYTVAAMRNTGAIDIARADSTRIRPETGRRLAELRVARTTLDTALVEIAADTAAPGGIVGILHSLGELVGLGEDVRVDTVVNVIPGQTTARDSTDLAAALTAAWQGRVAQVEAATQVEAIRLANVRHVGLMAPVAARVSRLISPAEVDTTTTNSGHLLNATVALVGDLIRENRAQDQRLAALEQRVDKLEGR